MTVNDVDALTKYTRDIMLRQLIRLTESPRGQRAAKAEIPEAPPMPLREADTQPISTPSPETPLATTSGSEKTEEGAREIGAGEELKPRQEEAKGMEGAEVGPGEQ